MTDLLPCPFCGGEAYTMRKHISIGQWDWCVVVCDDCGATVTRAGLDGTYKGAERAAIEAWNTRSAGTCHSIDPVDSGVFFICSNCNFGAGRIEFTPNYCPNCGRKVGA